MNDIEFSLPNESGKNMELDGNITVTFTIANNFCKVLEIYPSIKGGIKILLKGNDSFTVIVNDPLNTNGLLYPQISGDKILYSNKEKKEIKLFLIKLKEIQDRSGRDGCTEYPTVHHQSFASCIKDGLLRKTRAVFGFGLPFFSVTTDKITPLPRLERYEATVEWLELLAFNSFGGKMYQPAACLPQCTFLTATPKQQHIISFTEREVYLFFKERVDVQTTVLAYDMDSLLVEMGSSLGLWLGLSLVGTYDLLTAFWEKLAKKIQRMILRG